ncbi:hypothetical protein ATANTOWER_013308 [Ataeniobius toweri]|uniref:Uncharacterized protein n=1 Tax=Ataeniobius toweri TaxID=208326 RepID=A0ABU7BQ43_9TELE|nr:hypothetical protein [Ataeniobius toweri]
MDDIQYLQILYILYIFPRIPHEDKNIEARDVARYGGARVPPWSQAWGRDSPESAWWPCCSSRDLAGPSPNTVRDQCKEDWVADEGGDLCSPIPGCLGWP